MGSKEPHNYALQRTLTLAVTPDRLYLWKDAAGQPIPVEPTYEADAQPLLQPYFARAGVDPADVSGRAFELVVAAWLADQINHDLSPQDALVSVLSHLTRSAPAESCFPNRNSKDFDDPDIVDELKRHSCTLIPRFDDGLEHVRSHQTSEPA